MILKLLTLLLVGCALAAPADNAAETAKTAGLETQKAAASDLNTDASSYYDYGSRGYPSAYVAGGYGVTGYGSIDDRYSVGGGGYESNGYDRGYSGSYGTGGYSGYDGYSGGYGTGGGYGGSGAGGGYGISATNSGYGNSGVGGGYGGGGSYGAVGGYGGYGGYSGNGGLNSYYGYNNPSYQGYGHLGYGYYNRRPGYGNIYSSSITPSLVTGYRGYSRK